MKHSSFAVNPTAKPKRDRKALEQRRLKAIPLFKKGIADSEISRKLGVTQAAVHYWHDAWKKKGKKGLKSRGHSGPKTKLTPAKIKKVKDAILKGAAAAGYDTDMWTLSRIAKTIKKETKIPYHPGYVWRIIRALGFTPQKPETRYRDRNESAIKKWKKDTWPRIQKKGSVQRRA